MGLNTCKLSTFVCVEKYIAPSMLFVSCFHLIQRNNSTYQNSKYNSKNCENVKKFYYLFYSIICFILLLFTIPRFSRVSILPRFPRVSIVNTLRLLHSVYFLIRNTSFIKMDIFRILPQNFIFDT